jgi:sarcosine oxidase
MAPVHDVAIVGAGLLGLAAARAVAAQGRDFVVLEQAAIGHDKGGSKGSCRIFRLGYPEPEYVAAARQARELWHTLEAETGRQILLPTPHLTFGPQFHAVHDAMRQAGAGCELLSAEVVAERFPEIRVAGPALLETESCVTAADEALAALASAAGLVDPADPAGHSGPSGARLRTGTRVTGVADDGRQVSLQTSAGPVSARVVILTTGAWTAGLLAGRVPMAGEPRLEQVAYLASAGAPMPPTPPTPSTPPSTPPTPPTPSTPPTPPTPGAPSTPPTPIFISYGDPSPYGLPVPGSSLYKIGIHQSGVLTDPDAQTADPDQAMLARLAEVAQRYLPGYVPEPVATERCIYDNTPDEDFIVDRVGNVVVGCGTSGHGFKFGPLFGEWLAALAFGSAPPPSQRFGLARF